MLEEFEEGEEYSLDELMEADHIEVEYWGDPPLVALIDGETYKEVKISYETVKVEDVEEIDIGER